MNTPISKTQKLQQEYYTETAKDYDLAHIAMPEDLTKDEHYLGLLFLLSVIDSLNVTSILDVGAGTGRALSYIKSVRPDIKFVGLEPVEALREIGYSKGLSTEELRPGDGNSIDFPDGFFDLVCEFGVLHHVPNSGRVVDEMLRVSKRAIFISDSNNFGDGRPTVRFVKQLLNMLGLWRVADFIKTAGKGYNISEGDGVYYSYSVYNDYNRVAAVCNRVHVLNTKGLGKSPYRTASHVALLGVKE